MRQKIWLCFPFKQPLPLRPLSCNIRSNGGREHVSSLQIDEVPIRYGVLPVRLRKKLETFLQNTAEDIKRASQAQHTYTACSQEDYLFFVQSSKILRMTQSNATCIVIRQIYRTAGGILVQ